MKYYIIVPPHHYRVINLSKPDYYLRIAEDWFNIGDEHNMYRALFNWARTC